MTWWRVEGVPQICFCCKDLSDGSRMWSSKGHRDLEFEKMQLSSSGYWK